MALKSLRDCGRGIDFNVVEWLRVGVEEGAGIITLGVPPTWDKKRETGSIAIPGAASDPFLMQEMAART